MAADLPSPVPASHAAWWVLLGAIACLLFSPSARPQPVPRALQVEAAFLVNFLRYTEWPPERAGVDVPWLIAVVGSADAAATVRAMRWGGPGARTPHRVEHMHAARRQRASKRSRARNTRVPARLGRDAHGDPARPRGLSVPHRGDDRESHRVADARHRALDARLGLEPTRRPSTTRAAGEREGSQARAHPPGGLP